MAQESKAARGSGGGILGLGDECPNFIGDSQLGKITLHDYITGQWALLFSHPKGYTPVCTTELGMVAKLKKEFVARNTKVISVSVDTLEHHEGWIKDVNETQSCEVDFPIIADKNGKIAEAYGMVWPNQVGALSGIETARCVFIIDPNRRVQLRMDYPTYVGRNFYEILRAIDALQLTMYHKVATPANWKQGEDVLVLPTVTDDQAKELFPKGHTTIKAYLRVTPPPDT